jgi:hypothetical protein
MGARQQYRTMARMQRRRTWAQDQMGMRQDFHSAGEEEYAEPQAAAAPAQPDYVSELERPGRDHRRGL